MMTKMFRIFAATRYLVLIPVLGLTITSVLLFALGGYRLMDTLYMSITDATYAQEHFTVIYIVEFVHVFLIGTVLWITAIGLYQLFIHQIPVPDWMLINDIEQLETNLIGLVVVVLAVNFLGVAFTSSSDILHYGVAIALPIAALALYISVRGKNNKK